MNRAATTFFVNILVPIVTGAVYFIMAAEIKRVTKIRKLMFGEIGYNKAFSAFLLFGFYFMTRPLQNVLGPHPWPMVLNSMRQFFLMAVIAPAILVGILHWVPSEKGTPKSTVIAAYVGGFLMAVIFILINSMAIDGSKVLAEFGGWKIYDAKWFSAASVAASSSLSSSPDGGASAAFVAPKARLIVIHLITQLVSPVGYFLLAAAYVRHRRYNYPTSSVYNLIPRKWKYLEAGLLIFAVSMITAGFAAFFGQYYTYLWVIYFAAATVAGVIELISVKIPPREAPSDLKN
ncbi:MAG: hypothetical protein QME32_07260 [Endomicrobiia bacterium]|nr:hypothetical protein [Endomicrobiia bacterium]